MRGMNMILRSPSLLGKEEWVGTEIWMLRGLIEKGDIKNKV